MRQLLSGTNNKKCRLVLSHAVVVTKERLESDVSSRRMGTSLEKRPKCTVWSTTKKVKRELKGCLLLLKMKSLTLVVRTIVGTERIRSLTTVFQDWSRDKKVKGSRSSRFRICITR